MQRFWKRLKHLLIGNQYRVLVLRQKGVTYHQDTLTIHARSYEEAVDQVVLHKGIYDDIQILRVDLIEL